MNRGRIEEAGLAEGHRPDIAWVSLGPSVSLLRFEV